MSKWTARLKSEILKMGRGGTDKTDETPLLSVSSVPPGAVFESPDRLLSVLSVGEGAVSEKTALTGELIDGGIDPFDDRHRCTACKHLWPGNYCLQHRRAGLTTRDLAADFTRLAQRCAAFASREAQA